MAVGDASERPDPPSTWAPRRVPSKWLVGRTPWCRPTATRSRS